jgi:hypothetical protein
MDPSFRLGVDPERPDLPVRICLGPLTDRMETFGPLFGTVADLSQSRIERTPDDLTGVALSISKCF